MAAGRFQNVLQPGKRNGASLQRNRLAVFDGLDLCRFDPCHALHMGGGDHEDPVCHSHQDPPERGQGEGKNDPEGRAHLKAAFDENATAELFRFLADNGQPQPPAGDFRDDGTGRNLGLENEVERLPAIDLLRFRGRNDPAPDRRFFHPPEVDARAVVGDQDFDLVAVDPRHGDLDGRPRRLVLPRSLFGPFDAMIDAVAHEVNQGIFHFLQNAFVHFHFAAAHDQVRFLALVAAEVAN